ncbi:P-loop containing nucleoside triphosphate hydrolase protein [Mycena maculata]|uniref:P-loop containing nucleoside triphosphate hydrolase protein n=1 Tax=Mycena maculata TaxID=230809 RepID=A0AAD7I668_9AGAR|nr:P-loop containing nucleoside triphosphate hydrolase protein [Mycena maculata]
MDFLQLSALPYLTPPQKGALKKGNLQTLAELVLVSPQDLGRRCRISPLEAKAILNTVCENNRPQIKALTEEEESMCSTGDSYLDAALGGGLRTGMIWEVFGQSAAGKTQLALQLSLLVQIPPSLGGLSGSVCYITISSNLPTSRLLQIVEAHPLLSQEICGLEDISTIKCPTIPMLIHILSKILPDLVAQKAGSTKPVRLVVIDALAELFHSSDKTTTSTLIDRAQNIAEISTTLHALASAHDLAVLVLNEVTDVFANDQTDSGGDLDYKQQSRWFGRTEESNKEAALGLVWANQVNARIMLSRTGRRRYLDDGQSKRQKGDDGRSSGPDAPEEDTSILVRRLSVVFSSVGPLCSLDYIVTAAGISILPDDEILLPLLSSSPSPKLIPVPDAPPCSQVAPLDVGFAEARAAEDQEWENYWDADVISEDVYNSLELDTSE